MTSVQRRHLIFAASAVRRTASQLVGLLAAFSLCGRFMARLQWHLVKERRFRRSAQFAQSGECFASRSTFYTDDLAIFDTILGSNLNFWLPKFDFVYFRQLVIYCRAAFALMRNRRSRRLRCAFPCGTCTCIAQRKIRLCEQFVRSPRTSRPAKRAGSARRVSI